MAEDNTTLIVELGAVPVLVKCLQEPGLLPNEAASGLRSYELEVEKESAITLGLLAIKVVIFLTIYVTFLLMHNCISIGLFNCII